MTWLDANGNSRGFFDETERPGQAFPVETHMIIRDRYNLAAELAQGRRILEVGCGAGLGLRHLSSVAASLHAVEYSTENLAMLRSRYGRNIAVTRADAHALPYIDGRFDIVVALAMVYYLDMDRFVAEAHRVLTVGGSLFFCTSNKDVPGFCAAPYTTRYLSVPELKDVVESVGFECQMLGAFPADGGLGWRRVRAWTKGVAKAVVTKLPGGQAMWARLRQQSLVDIRPLPASVDEMQQPTTGRQPIDMNKPDRTYRVIYVIATRKSV